MLVMSSVISMAILGFGAMQMLGLGTDIVVENELVLGAPFEAEFEISMVPRQADAPKRVLYSGKLYRGSDGHKRIDRQGIVLIYDPITRTTYSISPEERIFRSRSESGPLQPSALFKNGQPKPGDEIEGIPCLVGKIPERWGPRELWVSPDLQEILFERVPYEKEDRITRLYNIKRTEPDPGLFKIPSDYVLVKD
jgi:hypothetical protein